MKTIFLCIAASLLLLFSVFSQENDFTAPVAKILPKTDTIHGKVITDNYHWLREKFNPEVINYLYSENAYTENTLKHTKLLQKKLYEELKGNYNETYASLHVKRDSFYYYNRMEKGLDYPIFCRKRDSLTAPEGIYFDANETAKDFLFFNLSILSVSPNHQLLAFGVDSKGDRLSTLYFKDLQTGELLSDSLPKVSSLIWANDNKTIFYILPEEKTLRSHKVFRHTLGTHCSDDELIFEEKDKEFGVSLDKSSSKQYIFIASTSSKTSEFRYLNANEPSEKLTLIQERENNILYDPDHYNGNEFFITTNWLAINNRVMKTLIQNPGKEYWIEVIPHRKNVLLSDFTLFKNFMILGEKEIVDRRVRIIERETGNEKLIEFNESIYSLSTAGGGFEYDDNKIRISYSPMLSPREIYDYDLIKDSLNIIYSDTLIRPYNKEDYKAERIFAKAPDGVEIPITIIYKKGMKLDSSNALFMNSYGSYGAANSVSFSASDLSFLDRGFIIATAHIRGSNDLGKQWHEDGKMLKKKNTFTDFIACAEHLIENGYTSKEKLAIQGASAGGLLMGAVVNMRPDLFKCVIAGVPFVDVINTMLDASLPLTTGEYQEWGNPNDREYYDYMMSYSPYDNVEAKNYPTMLVTAGYNDSQVAYWEPAKWVAKLRATKTDNNLLLLKTAMDGGHGRTSGRYNGLKEAAFQMAFVMHTLGIKENYIAVSGKVVDSNNELMPFVNIYVNGTTNGTTSNGNGEFYIEIKEGQNQELVFQTIGFKKHIEKIDINSEVKNLTVKLASENIELRQFVLSAKAKDPAYAIIKSTIAQRKYHLDLSNNYSVEVYIKGSDILNEIPEKLPKFLPKAEMPDSNNLGLLYLTESAARFHTQQPDNYKEEMLSSKVAGTAKGYSWNRVQEVMYNFYKNRVPIGYYSDKDFISPIADGAMVFYKYQYDGMFIEDEKMVNKIKVIPRNVADPLFHGHIYIFDKTWNIHSLDLFVTKDAQIMFVDTLQIIQAYAPVNDSVYMPMSIKLTSQIKFLGFDVTESYLGFFSNYQMNRTFPKKFFNNEIFKIENEANKKDSSYWVEARPVMLTEEEEKHYISKDSISTLQGSKPYLDSLDARGNKITFAKLLLSGYSNYSRYKKRRISISPLLTSLSYNTVEGTVLSYSLRYNKGLENKGSYSIAPTLRYGFDSENIYGKIRAVRRFNNFNYSTLAFEGGHYVNQFNHQEPIMELFNTFYTLLAQQNYMKLYGRTYSRGVFSREIINGLHFTTGLEYNRRRALVNSTDFTLIDRPDQSLTSNDPLNPFNEAPAFSDHNALIMDFTLRIRFRQKYETYPNYKYIKGSRFPAIYIHYKKGIEALGSSVNFDFAQIGVGKDVDLGYWGTSYFDIIGGSFFNTNRMSFIDFRHFNGNQTIFLKNHSESSFLDGGRSQMANFNNLPYYAYSTNSNFLELHYEHRFKGFILNKFPLIKKAGLGEVAGASAIYTSSGRDYQEVYFGLDGIARLFRIDFVASYVSGEKLVPQVRIGIKR
ncbi:MAG: DUF5686 family protein [Bacteroidota bacterium]|nr:DUF5686 family protein [Bacteroidota bacterium]